MVNTHAMGRPKYWIEEGLGDAPLVGMTRGKMREKDGKYSFIG